MADRRGFTNLYQNIPVQPLSGYSDPSAFIRVREAIRGVEDQLVQIRGLVGTSSPGFVTSVGLTAPTIFTVTGSPVTTSGTIALALASQAARSVFAAPTSGAGTPTFRALEAADIQSGVFGVSRGGTGFSTYAAGDILYSDATNSLAKLPVGSTGQVLKVAGGVPTWAADVGFANPMTTLGDLIYGDTAGAAARLAGNTTTTRQFLRQTGTGSASAAPAWDTVTKTDVGLGNVEDTALSTWGGSTNLVTLGTVTTGTWNATKVNVNYGGTGLTSVAANALLIGSTATSLGTIGPPGSAGTFFLSYSSTLPGYQWTDTIGVADGGTGQSSYTTGDMLYASGTTTLAKLALVSAGIMYGGASAPAWTAAADFTWDQTNKRVGIGTTTPLYPLHVEKNQDATTYTLVYNSNSGASARSVALVNTAAASVGLYSYSSGYTTSGGQIASGSAIGATGSNGLSIIATAATGSIRFYTSSTSAFQGVVTDTGNWGFGTDATAPTSLIYAAKNQNAATSIRVINTDAGVNASANVFLYTTATTGLELTSPGASSPNQLKLFSPLSGGLIMESSNASGFFSVATGGTYPGSERFRIDASGNVTIDTNVLYVDATNNRVGIGRTNPNTVLDVLHTVAGNAAVNMSNSSTDPAATARYILNNSTTSGGLIIRSTGHATEASDMVLYSSANNIRFYTGGNNRMSVGSTGNVAIDTNTLFVDAANDLVGIGTTPSYRFHVDQTYTGASGIVNTRFGTNVSPAAANANQMYGTYNTLTMNANATGGGRGIQSIVLHRFASNPGVLAAYASQIDNNDANTAMSTIPDAIGFWALTPSQNASGGTITRSYGLFVQPQSGTNITNSYGVYVNGSSDINYFAYRVGIGLNSPSETLHALGLVRFDKSSAAAYPNIRLRSNNDSYVSTWAIGQAPSSNNFLFAYNDGTSWFEYARITTTGNVGIGTSPGIRLDVSETQAVATSATFSAAAIRMNPVYTATGTITVKHRYIHFTQPTISGGTTTFTDAHTMYFDAAAGTHKAVDAGTTKTTPGTVNAWVKIDVNGTTYYIPAYTSKTA